MAARVSLKRGHEVRTQAGAGYAGLEKSRSSVRTIIYLPEQGLVALRSIFCIFFYKNGLKPREACFQSESGLSLNQNMEFPLYKSKNILL